MHKLCRVQQIFGMPWLGLVCRSRWVGKTNSWVLVEGKHWPSWKIEPSCKKKICLCGNIFSPLRVWCRRMVESCLTCYCFALAIPLMDLFCGFIELAFTKIHFERSFVWCGCHVTFYNLPVFFNNKCAVVFW